MFVDGEEITPELTRATDKKGVAQFIDKFGQRTTDVPDPAFILEGKGSPLYKADDLGKAIDSTPAKLTGFNLQTYLGDGKTVEIVTDPMHFRRTHEFQTLRALHRRQIALSGVKISCLLTSIAVDQFQ